MSHTNRNKPVMTSNGKTAIMAGISVGGAIFILAPEAAPAVTGLGFGLMLFAAGILVANQLPLWIIKVRAADSVKPD